MNKERKSIMKDSASSFEKLCEDKQWKREFEEGYRVALLSDIIAGMIEEEGVSINQIEKKSGVSKSIIQKIRSGDSSEVGFGNLLDLICALGYTSISFSGPGKDSKSLNFGEE